MDGLKMQQESNNNRIPSLVTECILLLLIAAFAFWVNRDIKIRGLYMDDLYMWSCYGEQSIWEFAFPIGTSTRFRPVYWLATYLQMMIVGTHVSRFVAFNIVCNIAAAWMLFYMAKKLSECRYVAAGVSICYLASRFAYYQIGQALGLMETMALVMAILILYLLYRYMQGDRDRPVSVRPDMRDRKTGYFAAALILYFLLAFTHERYISLFPMFYYVLTVRLLHQQAHNGTRKHWQRNHAGEWAAPAVVLAAIILIRSFAIGKALPAGTGGTEVTETFRISECIRYAFSQILYIFGVNDGPEHLNGLPWDQTPPLIKRCTKFSVLLIGLICIAFAILVLLEIILAYRKDGTEGQGYAARFRKHAETCILFVMFIALCIGCSSVTIRVEMRWIYVSYAAALLFAAYMIGEISEGFSPGTGPDGESGGITLPRVLATLLFAGYCILSLNCNLFYRTCYPKLYFWPNQLRMNSLAAETIDKYGTEGIFGKDIYILENTYEMTDFYARTFFKPYDPEKKAEGTRVIFADSLSDVPAGDVLSGKALVLKEVPEENAYRDLTEEIIKNGQIPGDMLDAVS